MTDVVEQAQELAKAATAPETFDFAAAVLDRDYPEVTVPVYLNEKKIRRLLDLQKQRDDILARASLLDKADRPENATNDLVDTLELLDMEYDELIEDLKGEKYTMHLRGISPEDSLAIQDKAFEAFPKEFEEHTHPLTGTPIKTLVQNEERDVYQAALYRQAHIVDVVRADGAVDANWSDLEKVKKMFLQMPALARHKVDEGIELATISTDFYRELTDEVF